MEEQFDVIDEQDQVIGQAARSDVHAQGWWHRGVHVLLFTDDGRLLIQKRNADRKQYASLLDCSVSEHVKAGEGYEEAAQRGVLEEMGVNGIALRQLFKFKWNYGPNDNEISMVFEGRVDPARVQFDPQEVSEVAYLHPEEVLVRMDQNPKEFCGWFIQIMKFRAGRAVDFQVMP
jgi:isopentenyldiphosphate isomerase